jgi:hypothetical protein
MTVRELAPAYATLPNRPPVTTETRDAPDTDVEEYPEADVTEEGDAYLF